MSLPLSGFARVRRSRVLATAFVAGALPLATAADVAVRPEPSGAFVVEDATGAIERLRVEEATGAVYRDGVLFLHTSGLANTFVGNGAGDPGVSGNNNTAFGPSALDLVQTGGFNAAFGSNALGANAAGNQNAAFGVLSLASNTASENSAFGAFSLVSNTTGAGNAAFGWNALGLNTTGGANTAVGSRALDANATGTDNVAVGFEALSNATGLYNTAVGSNALRSLASGSNNVAVGASSLYLATGQYNVGVGTVALPSLVTGDRNLALGDGAGFWLTGGSDNIYVGSPGHFFFPTESNTIRIGSQSTHTSTYLHGVVGQVAASAVPVVVGSDGKLGTIVSSARYKRDIADLGEASAVVQRLRPVSFRYRDELTGPDAELEYGLVAEEVADVASELVVRDAAGEPQAVRYQHLAPLLVGEAQRQERALEAQRAENARLRAEVDAQREEIAALARRLARVEAGLGRGVAGTSGAPGR